MARKVWTVSDLVAYFTGLIDQDVKLRSLWVEGEISNFTHHQSGHMYFTLKDERSRIQCVMFSRYNRLLLFQPKNGDRVSVRGELYVYERMGQVQFKAWEMRNSGLGDLYVAYLQLKERLEKEGLFAVPKKELPRFPNRVGVITSSRGAAVRDIITTIGRRYPDAQVWLYPVSVQGDRASYEIATAIEQMNQSQVADVLIVGRGGGSLEELWAFNEEMVVRAIADSTIPIISAVGHETDTTLSDYVSDLRAPTPTAAAELAVPDREEWLQRLFSLSKRLPKAIEVQLLQYRKRLQAILERPSLQQPGAQLDQYVQRLDYLTRDLQQKGRQLLSQRQMVLERYRHRLQLQQPERTIQPVRQRVTQWRKQMMNHITATLQRKQSHQQQLVVQLEALNPLQVMKRGYTLLQPLHEQKLISSLQQVKVGDLVRVRLQDGQIKCQVWKKEVEENERGKTDTIL